MRGRGVLDRGYGYGDGDGCVLGLMYTHTESTLAISYAYSGLWYERDASTVAGAGAGWVGD